MKALFLLVLVVLVTGCGSTAAVDPLPNDPYFAPVVPDMPRQKLAVDGAIFHSEVANSMYSDVKARRIGDIITVNLRESTNASKTSGTSTSKGSEVVVDPLLGLGGNQVAIGGDGIQLDLSSSNDFSGDASANQSNSLNGSISVTVIDVLPNMNLVVRGEKWLTLNNGDEYIRLTGIVRSADISTSNEVDSLRIANARIQYSGTGTFAQTQQQGWLQRFFSSEWWPL